MWLIDDVCCSLCDVLFSEFRDLDVEILFGVSIWYQIFVGGNVKNLGLFDLFGMIDLLQVIELVGGYVDVGWCNWFVLL